MFPLPATPTPWGLLTSLPAYLCKGMGPAVVASLGLALLGETLPHPAASCRSTC